MDHKAAWKIRRRVLDFGQDSRALVQSLGVRLESPEGVDSRARADVALEPLPEARAIAGELPHQATLSSTASSRQVHPTSALRKRARESNVGRSKTRESARLYVRPFFQEVLVALPSLPHLSRALHVIPQSMNCATDVDLAVVEELKCSSKNYWRDWNKSMTPRIRRQIAMHREIITRDYCSQFSSFQSQERRDLGLVKEVEARLESSTTPL